MVPSCLHLKGFSYGIVRGMLVVTGLRPQPPPSFPSSSINRHLRTDMRKIISFFSLLEVKLSNDPVRPSVGWSVGRAVGHIDLKGREVSEHLTVLPPHLPALTSPIF